jgi:hypothetical protein
MRRLAKASVSAAKIAANLRKSLVELVRTLASEDGQRDYQSNVPFVSVPVELVCMWFDDLYHPDDAIFRAAFTTAELGALDRFNDYFDWLSDNLPKHLPPLDVLQRSAQWAELSKQATKTLGDLGENADARKP